MPLYETVFIVRQDLSATEAEKVAKKYSAILEKEGGKVEKFEPWGLRDLAYGIRKNRKGHYFLFNVSAPSAAMLEMERLMRIDEDALRCLVVRVEEHNPAPSPILESRGDPRSRGDTRSRPDYNRQRPRGDGERRMPRGGYGDAPRDRDAPRDATRDATRDTTRAAPPRNRDRNQTSEPNPARGGDYA